MFSIQQIKDAHAKVKTGADFPKYIQELIDLGVIGYHTFVTNGRVDYFGDHNFKVSTTETYPEITINSLVNKELFIECLVRHQEGQSDYLTFCKEAGQCGVAQWTINILDKTCTYLDSKLQAILIEKIPL